MGVNRLGLITALAAVLSSAALTQASAATADTALWVRGASPGPIPISDVLQRIPPGYTLQEVDYPGGLFPWTGLTTTTGAQSIAAGVPALDAAIRNAQGEGQTLVIGESLGSLIVDQELRDLAVRPDAPDPGSLHFEVIADPTRTGGLLSYRPAGRYEPLTGTILKPVPETRYDVTVIKLQYDGIASWPDRPWHLLSVANALAGALYYHQSGRYGVAAQAVMNGEVPQENISAIVNAEGGVTTTYDIQQNPALLHPLEPILPALVAAVNTRVLAPAVNLGYSGLTPEAGPHLAFGGRMVTGKSDHPHRHQRSGGRER